jgi:hypothetical protein
MLGQSIQWTQTWLHIFSFPLPYAFHLNSNGYWKWHFCRAGWLKIKKLPWEIVRLDRESNLRASHLVPFTLCKWPREWESLDGIVFIRPESQRSVVRFLVQADFFSWECLPLGMVSSGSKLSHLVEICMKYSLYLLFQINIFRELNIMA